MGVFLCWSGENSRSHQIAKILDKRIPEILQTADTFLSSLDIPPGTEWMDQLKQAINDNSFGILCITPDNKDYPWLHFEAGALWRGGAKDRRVCPLLYMIRPAEISGPLSQLQGKEFNHDGFLEVMKAVNQLGASHPIKEESRLSGYFDRVWPDIEKDLSQVKQPPLKLTKPPREQREMVEEILTIVRSLQPGGRWGGFLRPLTSTEDLVELLSEPFPEKLTANQIRILEEFIKRRAKLVTGPDIRKEMKSETSPSPPVASDQPSQQP